MSSQTDQPYLLFSLKAYAVSCDSVSRPYSKGQSVTQIYIHQHFFYLKGHTLVFISTRHTVYLYSNRWAKKGGNGGSGTETSQQPQGALRLKTLHGKLLRGRSWLCTLQQKPESGPCRPRRARGQWIPIRGKLKSGGWVLRSCR